jgi:pimeloyl-ACP methyl ester carboxylesterase
MEMSQLNSNQGFTPHHISAQDGLSLYVRDYGPRHMHRLPVLCLPGLARTSADFHDVALALSQHKSKPRRVVSVDYRGRGRSAYDPVWQNYDLKIELNDVQSIMAAMGLPEAIFLGTSRGGILTMLMGASRGGAVKGAVLNDIGGMIEGAGIARIKSYVGKMPEPRNADDAVAILKKVAGGQFPGISDADWKTFAARTWIEEKGRFRLDYDPNLGRTLEAIDLERPLPPLWPYFDCLKAVPVLSIRGEKSDLFSSTTQAEMGKRHPDFKSLVVEGQGHAPLLTDKITINAIAAFCSELDERT